MRIENRYIGINDYLSRMANKAIVKREYTTKNKEKCISALKFKPNVTLLIANILFNKYNEDQNII
jgi:hypothetical protein